MSRQQADDVALAVDNVCCCQSKWYGKKSEVTLRTYPAWQTDPTRQFLDTKLDEEGRPLRWRWKLLLWAAFIFVASTPWWFW